MVNTINHTKMKIIPSAGKSHLSGNARNKRFDVELRRTALLTRSVCAF